MEGISPLVPTPVNATTSPTSSGVMGKDDFLRLLVTQLKNQDPVNPLQAQEFAAQLAQFTSVEQLAQIHQALSQSQEVSMMLAQSMNSGVAAGLIGRTVEAKGNQVQLGGEPVSLAFELGAPAASVRITVRNEMGAVVRVLEDSHLTSGVHSLTWDGKATDGSSLPDGVYTFEVEATTSEGTPVGVTTLTSGRVTRVSFHPDGILLWLDRLAIPMSDVRNVSS